MAPEGATISNQDPEVPIFTMVVLKWSDVIKVPRVKVYGPLCGGLYRENYDYIVPYSGTYLNTNMNCFTWSKEEND